MSYLCFGKITLSTSDILIGMEIHSHVSESVFPRHQNVACRRVFFPNRPILWRKRVWSMSSTVRAQILKSTWYIHSCEETSQRERCSCFITRTTRNRRVHFIFKGYVHNKWTIKTCHKLTSHLRLDFSRASPRLVLVLQNHRDTWFLLKPINCASSPWIVVEGYGFAWFSSNQSSKTRTSNSENLLAFERR